MRSSRLLLLAAAAALLMSMLFFFVVFPFNEAVASAFESEAEVAGYLGVFSSVAAAATFLFSLLVTKRLFARWGIVLALAAVPAIYLAGFSLWMISFGLAAAAVIRGAQWVAVNAIGSTAYAALFNVVTGRRRGQVMTFMTAVPAQIGTVIAGLVLVVGSALPRPARFGMGLVLALVLLVVVMAMRPAYYDAVVGAVRQGLVGVLAVPQRGLVTPVDADAKRVLMDHLGDARPDTRALALSALAYSEDEDTASHVEPFLGDESPLVRVAAFDSMCVLHPDRILEHAQTAFTDPAHEVRLRVLGALAAAGGDDYRGLVAVALDDPDSRVAAAAAAMLGGESCVQADRRAARQLRKVTRSAPCWKRWLTPSGKLVVDPTPYLDHPHRQIRVLAASAYPYWPGDTALLLPGLDDPSLRVRRASARALAQLPDGEKAPRRGAGDGHGQCHRRSDTGDHPVGNSGAAICRMGLARSEAGLEAPHVENCPHLFLSDAYGGVPGQGRRGPERPSRAVGAHGRYHRQNPGGDADRRAGAPLERPRNPSERSRSDGDDRRSRGIGDPDAPSRVEPQRAGSRSSGGTARIAF